MREQMSGAGAVELMLDPASRIVNRIVIPEGSRLSAISAEVQKITGLPREQIDAALADPALGLPAYASGPEGYLFPATYEAAEGRRGADRAAGDDDAVQPGRRCARPRGAGRARSAGPRPRS